MSVQFIIGAAGSGKSHYIMQTVARQLKETPQKKIILMVPEQATFLYQSALINQYQLPGVLTLEVLSFQRLSRVVMQQVGGLATRTIDDLGKLLILRRLLQNDSEQYPYLSQSINRPGSLYKIGQVFQELKRYRISSQELANIIQNQTLPKTAFTNKLCETSNLYSSYETFLSQNYMDSEDLLEQLRNCLEQQALFEDTDIWVDEFYDFTPQEYAILEILMRTAANLFIALPYDANQRDLSRQSVFRNTGKTLEHLRKLAFIQNITVLPDILLQPVRWKNTSDLAFLEKQYFSLGNTIYQEKPLHLSLLQGQNRVSEVDAVARRIRQFCREQRYQYNEIGIFTRGTQYELLLETVLTDYDIPYFIDHKAAVYQHPLTELLLSVFDIIQNNWNYQSMFRLLKTELLPFSQQDIDILENYVLQYGIRGNAWYQEKNWCYGQDSDIDLTSLNQLRIAIATPLRHLQQALAEPIPVGQIIQAIYKMLEAFLVPERLDVLCQESVEVGLLETAQMHQQIWDRMIQIFDQINRILQDTRLSAREFSEILYSAFDNLDVGLLPNSLDQIQIGALSHSRSHNLKVVFILGLNEGVFPAKGNQDSFFNDMEKQTLHNLGITLSPNSREQLYEEQFFIYLALTRASEHLCVSYSLSDEEGKALRPSGIVTRLKQLYPILKEESVQWPPREGQDILPYLNHPDKAMGLLGEHLNKEMSDSQEIWLELYNWFLEHPTTLFETVQQSLHHEESFTKREISSTQIYGIPFSLSVSSLERYRQCPYSYYLTYGLRLKERKFYKMEAVDIGQFYHTAIEQFSNYLLEHQITWQILDEIKIKTIVEHIVDTLTPVIQNEILLSNGRYRYLRHRFQKTLERSARFLMEHGQQGDFVPVALEADFGTSTSSLPRWEIFLKDGTKLRLQGRIDRIEHARFENRHYLRVIDFKTGTQGLHLVDIYYGLKIQLLTYLQVALKYFEQLLPPGEIVLPAGVLYYFFRSGILSVDGPLSASAAEQLHFVKMRADGILVADMHALKLAQKNLTTGSSSLLPVSLLTKANPYLEDPDSFAILEDPMEIFRKPSNAIVTKEQLERLMRHTKRMITSIGEEIHSGNITIHPCHIRQFISCQYCHYQAICQIQTVDLQKNSEELSMLSREEIWKRIEQEEREEEKGGE